MSSKLSSPAHFIRSWENFIEHTKGHHQKYIEIILYWTLRRSIDHDHDNRDGGLIFVVIEIQVAL
jgi:hypothetical protein